MNTIRQRMLILAAMLAMTLWSATESTAAPGLSLGITPAGPGATASATVALTDVTDVESFSLELTMGSGTTLQLPASGWLTRGAYFPISPFGSAPTVELNNAFESTARTTVYIDGFKPTGTNGAIGTVSFAVSPSAVIGESQDLTLSGVYYSKGSQSVIPFSPATVQFLASAASNYNLNVSLAGNGSGSVNSDPAGIACTTGSSSGCSKNFTSGSMVTLMPLVSNGSAFSGWSGACTASSGDCVITMNAGKTATATFTNGDATVAISGTTDPYFTIDSALDAVLVQGKTVRSRNQVFTENVIMISPVTIILKGGYADTGFSSQPAGSYTTIDGSLSIRSGTLKVDRVKIK